jgi:glucose/arabinose dehydrogenase
MLLFLLALQAPACDADNGGLRLPPGFCATAIAKDLVGVRHLAVAADGSIFAGRHGNQAGLYHLRDTTGDGKIDLASRVFDTAGTGVVWTRDAVYFSPEDRVLRFPWTPGARRPSAAPEVIVHSLPTGGHTAKSMVLGKDGALFVVVGSRTNSCQEKDRVEKSPGIKPCAELATRGGIWRFDSRTPGQTQASGKRWGTGLRNAMAMSLAPDGTLWAAIHGRDQLTQNWGFSEEDGAENPAEELGPITEGVDYGWPYCYYDPRNKRKVQAPEYGGNGTTQGDCGSKTQPAVAFPAHWAPNATVFYTGTMFPARYRGGIFVAFHGSWNRAPRPQQGFRVAFAPFENGKATGKWEDFALPAGEPNSIRPSGLAVGPDGSLYIGADREGKIWRVVAVDGRP